MGTDCTNVRKQKATKIVKLQREDGPTRQINDRNKGENGPGRNGVGSCSHTPYTECSPSLSSSLLSPLLLYLLSLSLSLDMSTIWSQAAVRNAVRRWQGRDGAVDNSMRHDSDRTRHILGCQSALLCPATAPPAPHSLASHHPLFLLHFILLSAPSGCTLQYGSL
jgi:hypothetical protein